jgi:hypothetical protein
MKCVFCNEEIEEGKELLVDLDVSGNKQPCHSLCFEDAYYEVHQDKDGEL